MLAADVPTLFSYVDSSQCYRYVNRSYEKLFQQPADAIVGKTVEQLFGRHHYENLRPHIEAVLSGKEVSFEAEFEFNERPLIMEVDYIPDRDKQGIFCGFFVLETDITKHKQVEEALRESKERLASVVDNAVEAIITINREGIVQDFNRAAERIFGYSLTE